MIQTPAVDETVKGVFEVLSNHGVVILPSKLGYRILAMSEQGVDKMYRLKDRPPTLPSGILATPEILSVLTTTHLNLDRSLRFPVAVIDHPKLDNPAVQSLPPQVLQKGTLAFFLNLDDFMRRLCEFAWEKDKLIVCSCAKKSGSQECFQFAELHPEFKQQADYITDEDDLSLLQQRGKIDNCTLTIIDLNSSKMLRKGVFATLIRAHCIEKFILTDHLPLQDGSGRKKAVFRSCIFLQSFKEITYDRIPHIRDSDWLALDLEDGCPQPSKPLARQLIEKHAHLSTFDHQCIVIRLNGLDQRAELYEDLQIKYTDKIWAFALPMLRGPTEVDLFDQLITEMEINLGIPQQTFKFFPVIETPEGLQHAVEIAKASSRNVALLLGHSDLFAALNAERTALNLHAVRLQFLLAARAGGLYAIDTPFEDVKNIAGLEKDARDGRQLGLDGKVALGFEQLSLINTIYSLPPDKKLRLESMLRKYQGKCEIIDGKFIAPPIIKKIEAELAKPVLEQRRIDIPSTRGKSFSYGLDFRRAQAGLILKGACEVTIDTSWITSWQSLVQTGNPVETSVHFCKSAGLRDRLVPFQMLINLGLCLMVEPFSESSLYHLGIRDAIYERPVYPGDSLRAVMIIDQIKTSSQGQYSIFMTRLILVNQDNQRVISMKRNSLFEFMETPEPTNEEARYDHPDYYLFVEKPFPALRKKMIESVQQENNSSAPLQALLQPGDLILHGLTRQLGLSNNLSYSTLYKNTHPLHINKMRFGEKGIVTCGGFLIPIIHAAASRDIRFAIDHEISDTMHINKMHHEDCIGAMTYILDVQEVREGIEYLTLRTFGLKNLDAERDLANVDIPDELLKSPEIRPREIELLCKVYCPELHHKICARMTWQLWRKAGVK